jgi:23S rRNA (adenine2503-C2)-methyltransferase
MNNLYDYTLEELEVVMIENKFKKFNARQIYEWLYKKGVTTFDEMTNISKNLRAFLTASFMLGDLLLVNRQVSNDGTEKYLLETKDQYKIEAVLMRHNYGNSICVTSQIGCNIGCTFCASGLYKKTRDLTAGEMVAQVMQIKRLINERVSHVVVMGIGEPFDNYENVMRFIESINSPYGLEIGKRHITVSTSGIVPKIDQFGKDQNQVNLAISLHAPNNLIRSKIMKINNTYPIEKVIDAAKRYVQQTNRRITFEYILLDKVNDEISHADQLSDLLRGINCYVNLIRYNEVMEFNYKGSSEPRANAFHQRLLKRGITATLRKEKGSDIDAACGQLRSKEMKKLK